MGQGPQNRPDTFDPHPYPAKLGSDGNNCCSLNGINCYSLYGIIVVVYMKYLLKFICDNCRSLYGNIRALCQGRDALSTHASGGGPALNCGT